MCICVSIGISCMCIHHLFMTLCTNLILNNLLIVDPYSPATNLTLVFEIGPPGNKFNLLISLFVGLRPPPPPLKQCFSV